MAERGKRKNLDMNDEQLFRLFVEESRDMIYRMSLPEGRYEYVSPASTIITGFSPQEIYDSPMMIRQQIHPDWRDYLEREFAKLLAGDMPDKYEYQIYDKSGNIKWINQRNVLITDAKGVPVAIDGILTDVTELKETQALLQKEYDEKKDLLRELQHRVKNSFNMLYSMIQLSADSGVGREAQTLLTEISAKIKAVAEMYDLLYQTDALLSVCLDDYHKRILDSIPAFSDNVTIDSSFDAITLSSKLAIPVGIITAELINNAIKHAYPDGREGVIEVSLKKAKKDAILAVRDDGTGFPADFDPVNTKSLGLKMINTLTQQLDGSFSMETKGGTVCILQFPLVD